MKNKLIKTLLTYYKNHKQKTNNTSLEHCIAVTQHMLEKSKYCFLITHGDQGWCSARLVEPIIATENDTKGLFKIWIGTRKDLRKAEEVWSNPNVTLTFENTREDANLVIYGKAFIETDPKIKRKYWKGAWRMFFPAGPEQDEYIAIRIEPLRMEVMNFSKNITPEPFGLKAAVLINHQNKWQLE